MNNKDTKKENFVRKQVMLSKENIEKISSIAKKNNTSFSHVVRNAIEWYDADFQKMLKRLGHLEQKL